MAGHGFVRLYARVALVGFWSLLVGAIAVLVAARLLPMANGDGGTTAPRARISIAPILAASLGGLIDAGVASIGVGALLLLLGLRLSASATRV